MRVAIPTDAVCVPPSRLSPGHWCHTANRQLNQGDINASYSAASIAFEGKVRRPFRLQGQLWVTVSIAHQPEIHVQAYRLVEPSQFDGEKTTYTKVVRENAEAARRSPDGFYHGIVVTHGKQSLVLAGPPIVFRGDRELEPVQGSLF